MTNQAHTQPDRTLPTRDQARAWLQRWDDQQATYFSDRDERFEVICDVLVETVQRSDPLVVDLGVGPGSLARTVLRRIPGATVVGVDMDPLLLGLASAAYAGDRFRLVQADLRRDVWLAELDLPRAPDAFISTTALHWIERAPLQRLLRTAAESLSGTGVFVDGDHLSSHAAAPTGSCGPTSTGWARPSPTGPRCEPAGRTRRTGRSGGTPPRPLPSSPACGSSVRPSTCRTTWPTRRLSTITWTRCARAAAARSGRSGRWGTTGSLSACADPPPIGRSFPAPERPGSSLPSPA